MTGDAWADYARPLLRPARFEELPQDVRVVLEEMRQVGEDFHRGRAEMMFDAFDVLFLSFRVEAEQRKEARQRFVTFLDVASDALSFVGQHQSAIFFVIEVAEFAQLLHHAGNRRLFDLQRRGDIHDTRIALFLDQLVDALQVVFSALTRGRWRGHVAPINHKNLRRRKCWEGRAGSESFQGNSSSTVRTIKIAQGTHSRMRYRKLPAKNPCENFHDAAISPRFRQTDRKSVV